MRPSTTAMAAQTAAQASGALWAGAPPWSGLSERKIAKIAPEALFVLLRAMPEVVRRRITVAPHEHQVIRERYEPFWTNADRSASWALDRQGQFDRAWASYL